MGCKYNLYLDVNPESGSIKINLPDVEPWEMVESCSLDVADRGIATLDEVGLMMNMTKEGARLVELHSLVKLQREPGLEDMAPLVQIRRRPK